MNFITLGKIVVMNLENEVVSSQFRKEIRCHNNAGKAELSFLQSFEFNAMDGAFFFFDGLRQYETLIL